MDGHRFDDITRAIGSGATRRRVLQGIAGGGLLAALGLRTTSRTSAQACGAEGDSCGLVQTDAVDASDGCC